MTEYNKGYLAAIIYAVIVGFSLMAAKIAISDVPVPVFLADRLTLSFIGACLLVAIRRESIRIPWKEFLAILPMALVFPGAFFLLQTAGLSRAPSSLAGILQGSAPVFTAILAAIFLREKTRGWGLVGIFLTLAGLVVISLDNFTLGGGSEAFLGCVFLILTAVSMAVYSVMARLLSKSHSLYVMTFYMQAVGCVIFLGYSFLSGYGLGDLVAPLGDTTYLIAILFLSLAASLLTSWLTNYALARVEATKVSVTSALSTVIAIVAGILFLGEQLSLWVVLGMITIIIGVYLVNRKSPYDKE